ncbi:diaminopimelate epimerase [Methylocapsa palsarum]|uniref:Diaminopimelate epimerase n=2 Tax=Methylocapsa palsarum TaxID=1612308 RepID=A0A1I3Z7A2_9HYPH|nr:diaminopimelate epimerase [Methylocapsa palsarum]
MNGLGNEIVVLDLRGSGLAVSGSQARAIWRGEGLAFDQLMALQEPRSPGTAAFVTIFNNDGSEAGACGNGTRCVAWTLMRGAPDEELVVETIAGQLRCRRTGESAFAVEMGRPRLAWREIPLAEPVADTRNVEVCFELDGASRTLRASAVSMGNPHAIFFPRGPDDFDLARLGPILERHPMFPERANISRAEILSRTHIRLDVWERGAGLTRACGSAACAALVAAVRDGRCDRRAIVSLPGGDLEIEWRGGDDMVVMTGPVEFEFETRLDPALFEERAA